MTQLLFNFNSRELIYSMQLIIIIQNMVQFFIMWYSNYRGNSRKSLDPHVCTIYISLHGLQGNSTYLQSVLIRGNRLRDFDIFVKIFLKRWSRKKNKAKRKKKIGVLLFILGSSGSEYSILLASIGPMLLLLA